MQDCIFCRILRRELPSSIVFEDTLVVAFLDICPINAGHTLVIGRRHAELLADLSSEELHAMIVMTQRVAWAQRAALKCDGNTIHLANGETAGQEIPHAHFHVIPRRQGDGFGLKLPPGYGANPPRTELDATALKLREALRLA